jgi:hypothetical protein
LLESWVRIPPGNPMFVSGRGFCDGPIPRPEKSYPLWCMFECDKVKIKKNLYTYCEQHGGRWALTVRDARWRPTHTPHRERAGLCTDKHVQERSNT